MTTDELRARILAAFPGAQVEVGDLTGTSDHFDAVVIAPQFAGRTRIEQHQMVYRALGEAMAGPDPVVHALALKTHAPQEQTDATGAVK
jgi:stress-induced morphogen